MGFLQVYDKYFQNIYDYAYYSTMNKKEAEKVTTETFLKASKDFEAFENKNKSIHIGLYKIAFNNIRDASMNKKEPEKPDKWPYKLDDKKERLKYSIQFLPYNEQQAVILRYIQGLSNNDTAAVMEKTEEMVKHILHNALTSLQERMMENE